LKKKLIIVSVIGLSLYVLSWLTGTQYVWKAIVYNYVDYDDYKIFDNRTIAHERVVAWEEATPQRSVQLPMDLDNYLTEMESIGVLAIRNDSIICEKYWDDYDETTLANSFSVAKSYISMLVGFALKDGSISSLDQSVRDFLPSLDEATFQDIKLKHLITMSSGLEWIESYGGPINHTTESYYGKDLWRLVSNLKKEHDPGKVYNYKGCDPQLLAYVIEKATGNTVTQYLSKKFWKPVGSNADGLWSVDHEEGIEKAYCCINTNVRNFARIGKLYLNYGNWNGRQLLDSSWIAESTRPHGLPNTEGVATQYYGYQWWCMNDMDKNVFYCRGLNGQYVICFPEKNLVIVRVGHKRETSGNHPTDLVKLVEWGETL